MPRRVRGFEREVLVRDLAPQARGLLQVRLDVLSEDASEAREPHVGASYRTGPPVDSGFDGDGLDDEAGESPFEGHIDEESPEEKQCIIDEIAKDFVRSVCREQK